MEQRYGASNILYAKGCEGERAIDGGIDEAVKLASQADVVLLSMGLPGWQSGEASSRSDISVPAVLQELLDALNNLPFYSAKGPKSLGREWVESEVLPLMDSFGLSLEDRLATFCEHVAVQISSHIKGGKVLLTGGGALNKYLVERMQANAPQCEYFVPDKQTVNFKEALIFAFLGALYMADMPNCMSSVTGARYNCIGGALYKAGGVK